MALNASKIKGNGPKVPDLDPGTYPARVVQVLSLGLQNQRPYKGEEKPPAHELYVVYELSDEFLKDADGNDDPNKPRWISEKFPLYNLKSEKAKSTKRYFSLDPENKFSGDWSKVVGTPVNITIAINPPMKKVTAWCSCGAAMDRQRP